MRFKKYVFVLALICFASCVIWCAIVNSKTTAAVRQIERRGGYVTFVDYGPRWLVKMLGDSYPFKSVLIVEFGLKDKDEDLALLASFKKARYVNLDGTDVKGTGLLYLKDMPNLQEIGLTGSAITDEGLKTLTFLSSIKRVTLAKTDISDQGVVYLAEIPKLKELTLADTKISDLSLRYLARSPLKELDVRGTLVTSNGIAFLKLQNPSLDIIH